MSSMLSPKIIAADCARRWRLFIYPRLRELPVAEQDEALQAARRTALDMLERIGVLAALAGTAALVHAVGANGRSLPANFVVQFALALPVLCVLAGPFLLRRTRRGLDLALSQRSRSRRTRSSEAHPDSRAGARAFHPDASSDRREGEDANAQVGRPFRS
jgi:hypothetical protein